MIKIGAGLLLLVIGFMIFAVSIFSFIDPAASKLMDDGDPFGPPPSRLSSAAYGGFGLLLCGIGLFMILRSVKTRRAG